MRFDFGGLYGLSANTGESHERGRPEHQHPQVPQDRGVTSQREIEKAVRAAIGSGRLKGNEALPAKVTLTVGGIDLTHSIDASIELE